MTDCTCSEGYTCDYCKNRWEDISIIADETSLSNAIANIAPPSFHFHMDELGPDPFLTITPECKVELGEGISQDEATLGFWKCINEFADNKMSRQDAMWKELREFVESLAADEEDYIEARGLTVGHEVLRLRILNKIVDLELEYADHSTTEALKQKNIK